MTQPSSPTPGTCHGTRRHLACPCYVTPGRQPRQNPMTATGGWTSPPPARAAARPRPGPCRVLSRPQEDIMNGLQDKVAIITGGSSGIGQAIAIRLGEEGANGGVHFG